jgi:hypothetical protein
MKLDNIPEQELLELPKKTEEEQAKWLSDKYILKSSPVYLRPTFTGLGDRDGVCEETLAGDTTWNQRLESLADLAERLWEKMWDGKSLGMTWRITRDCLLLVGGNTEFEESLMKWWAMFSRPIHRIVAALTALKRAGVEI